MGTLSRVRSAGKCSGAPNLVARCMELPEGHAHAALLLMRILFWMPKATVRHGGHTLIAKLRRALALLPTPGVRGGSMCCMSGRPNAFSRCDLPRPPSRPSTRRSEGETCL